MTSPRARRMHSLSPAAWMRPGLSTRRDSPVGRREASQHLARRVHARPVGDQDLGADPRRPLLREHGPDTGLDVRLFVEARNRDGYERLHQLIIRRADGSPAGTLARPGSEGAPTPRPWTFALCSFRTAFLRSAGPAFIASSIRRAKPFPCPHHGVWPAILTAANPSTSRLHDPSLLRDLPRGVEVERARTLEPGYEAKRAAWRAQGHSIAAFVAAFARRAGRARSPARWRASGAVSGSTRSCGSPPRWAPSRAGSPHGEERRRARQRSAVLAVPAMAPLAQRVALAVVLDYRATRRSNDAQRLRDDAIANRPVPSAIHLEAALLRPGRTPSSPRPTSFARTCLRASHISIQAASSPFPTATTRTTSPIRSRSPPGIDSSSPTPVRSSRSPAPGVCSSGIRRLHERES